MEISIAKKEAGVYCCAYACSNKPIKRKGGLCHKHYARKRREIDPVYARFNQWKSKCAQRGIINTVNIEEFRAFCNETGYIVTKGNRGMNATIDRIKNYLGYTIDNIQLLTHKENIRKYFDEDRFSELPF